VALRGVIIDLVINHEAFCQCGNKVDAGQEVGYWRSHLGAAHDKVVYCPYCKRPKTLLGERKWLMQHRERILSFQDRNLEMRGSLHSIDAELDANWRQVNIVFLRLLDKLPHCQECSDVAYFHIPNGPYYCKAHANGHSTAVSVEWSEELDRLGPEQA
jgi:glutaredoxin